LCLELRFHNSGRLIIIDAGSGMRALGDNIISQNPKNGQMKAEVFLTHTHLDHILGLPFFAPIYNPRANLKIYGPVTCEETPLKEVIGGQFSYRYFPVRENELEATIEYVDLKEGRYDLGDGIQLTAKYLNHPLLCLGYRIEYCGKIICTAYDTEPFYNVFSTDSTDPSYDELLASEGESAARKENQRMEEFFYGADLLIHDGQYTMAEYEGGKKGWGHTPIESIIGAARRASVKRLAICHHDPLRSDSQIDELSEMYRSREFSGNMETFFAREGMQVEIS
jgi:ribonuclease BN (tRNA processing enzyme)